MTAPWSAAATPASAPGAPWRRHDVRARDRRPSTSLDTGWSWPRAIVRLLRTATIVATGVLRLSWLGMVRMEPDARAWRTRACIRTLAAALLRTLHVRVQVAGPRPAEPVLYACNHLSWLDVLVLLVAVPDCVLVAKREVARWPLVGGVVRRSDTVLVDRVRSRSLPHAIAQVAAVLAGGRSVALFAEGTTTDGSQVLPFKSSFFDAAIGTGAAVVPVSLRASTGAGGPAVARHVCWWGEASLVQHLPLVAGTRQIQYFVRLGEPLRLLPVPSLAPTRYAVAPAGADRALRRFRSVRRHLLARRAHHVVQRQGGYASGGDASDAQRRGIAIEQRLPHAR